MTEEVLFPEVPKKVVVIKVALVTELAQRMTFVRAIIPVTFATMMAKLRPSVELPINCEQLQSTQKQVDF